MRFRRIVPMVVAALLVAPTAAGETHNLPPGLRLASPSVARLGEGPLLIRDSKLSAHAARSIAAGPSWGGFYTTPSGASVQILVSTAYPQDETLPQKWANFLDSLVHGKELSDLTVYLAPIDEVQSYCGDQALACYDSAQSMLVAPGEQVDADVSAEAVVTHEYGHHIAANRSNAPWTAIDTGTKRWASYLQVCQKTGQGALFPGAEDMRNYQLNPGEGFAEQYRVLNERRAGLAEVPWEIVSQALYPDAISLSLLEQDVVSPWPGTTAATLRGTVSAKARSRSFSVATALDGTLKATLHAPPKTKLAFDLYAGSTRVGHAVTTLTGRSRTLQATVCGVRAYRVSVTRVSGTGAFSVGVSKP